MMESDDIKLVESLRPYYSIEAGKRVLEELKYNSYRMIQSVYRFKNFQEFEFQKKGNIDDKSEVYLNASYFELLIDYIKISVAFENYNKVVLLENGYVVHEIKKDGINNNLASQQKKRYSN